MFINCLIFVKLLFIQVTVSQCLPRSLQQNGQHFIPQSQKVFKRGIRQTNPLPAELAMTNSKPISNLRLQNTPCGYGLQNSLIANNVLQNSFPNNGLISNINGLNNAINMPIGNLGLQNSPCDYGLPNSLAANNILQNNLPLNMPGNGLMPNAYGCNNAIKLPVNNGVQFSNDVTFSNNIATNNFLPNAYNVPLTNNIPNSNVVKNVFNTNNMPAANFLPNMNTPSPNSVPNMNNLSPLNIAPLNMPGSIPVNNLVNINNLPINNILPSGNGMLPNLPANLPQNNLPITNGYNLLANNIFPTGGYANLPQNNMPIANGLQNMNNLPIANNFPNINYLNNLPVSNEMSCLNNLPTNVILKNGLSYASNNIPSSSNVQFNGVSNINNPLTISNNVPLDTIFPNTNSLPRNNLNINIPFFTNDRFINEGFNAINGIPNSEFLNNNLLLPNNKNLPNANNWPCNNAGVNSALHQNVLQNASPATNIQLENQLGFVKDLASNLQIEGFGNLPLLNGLPIAGITETVTLLNTPYNCS